MLHLLMSQPRRVSLRASFSSAITRTALRIAEVASEFTAPAPQLPAEPVEQQVADPTDVYGPADMPALDEIEAAAAEYERAADLARRADRGKRAAKRILDRLPAGSYGRWLVERVSNNRQTADLKKIQATYKRLGLGPVPMKQTAPSLKVTLLSDAQAPAELQLLAGAR